MKNKSLIREKNDCLTHCVAYYFRENPANVPFFVGNKNWMRSLKEYFKRRGKKIERLPYDEDTMAMVSSFSSLVFIQGYTLRSKTKQHAVIYKHGKPIFDPSPSQKFLKGEPTYIYIINNR